VNRIANKAIPVLLVLLVLAYVVKEPAQAGHTVAALWAWLGDTGSAFGRFLDSL
jgi:ABC-type microcin C transport system permease subunit YejE